MTQPQKSYEQSLRSRYRDYFTSNYSVSATYNTDGSIAEYDLVKKDRYGAVLEIDKFSGSGFLKEIDGFVSGKLNLVATFSAQGLLTEIDRYAVDGSTILEKDIFEYPSGSVRPNKETITDGSGALLQTDIFSYGANGALSTIVKYDPSGNLIETDTFNSRGKLIGITNGATTTSPTGTNAGSTGSSWSVKFGYGEIDVLKAFSVALNKTIPDVPFPSSIKNNPTLSVMHFDDAWAAGYTGKGIVIADIDTGIDLTNKDVAANISSSSWNFINNSANVQDDNGHGTFTASEMVAANNGIGLTGAAYDAQLMVLKALDSKGEGTTTNIASAINWAVDHGANVINMSLGWTGPDSLLESALQNAKNHGVIIAVAAGNSSGSSPDYPAAYAQSISTVISVGASSIKSASSFSFTSFSNQAGSSSPYNFVDAPGQSVLGYALNSSIQKWSGTSMSAPLVAAEAADLLSANAGLSSDQIVTAIVSGTVSLGSTSTQKVSTRSTGRLTSQASISSHTLSLVSSEPTFATGLMGDEVSQAIGQTLGNVGWDSVISTSGINHVMASSTSSNNPITPNVSLRDVLNFDSHAINLGGQNHQATHGDASNLHIVSNDSSYSGHDASSVTAYDMYINHSNQLFADTRLHLLFG